MDSKVAAVKVQSNARQRCWNFQIPNATYEQLNRLKELECKYLIFSSNFNCQNFAHDVCGYVHLLKPVYLGKLKKKISDAIFTPALAQNVKSTINHYKQQNNVYEKGVFGEKQVEHINLFRTKGELRNPTPSYKRFNSSTIIRDQQDRPIIWFQKKKVGTDLVGKLYESTLDLEKVTKFHYKDTNRHSQEKTLHVGCWRKMANVPYVTSDSRNPDAQKWMQENDPLFQLLGDMFKTHFPYLYRTYLEVKLPCPRLGAWATCAINFNYGAISKHIDSDDYRSGLCWVTTCGNYENGELFFPQLNMEFAIQPGDVIAFKSFELEHEVKQYTGSRYSIVLFQHHDLFFPGKM